MSGWWCIFTGVLHVSFLDHMHDLDAAQNDTRAVEILESQHRSDSALDGAMVLLNDVVQILDLTNLDRGFALGIHRMKRGQIGSAFINGYRLARTVLSHRLFKKPP